MTLIDTINKWEERFTSDMDLINKLIEQLEFESKPTAVLTILKLSKYGKVFNEMVNPDDPSSLTIINDDLYIESIAEIDNDDV